jgi:tetratricopeptide (TPR) repeat protein
MCLELLARSAALMADPLPLLNALPRNWQAIRAATRLLEMGRTEDTVVRFARESFSGLERGGTMQAVEERRRCQAQLALLEEDTEQALSEQRESAMDFLFFQSSGNALGLSVLATKQPDRLLAHLDASVRTEMDLPTLYYLVEEARSWQSLLIARVYARMFSARPIATREAIEICEQMLAALRALPDTVLKQEYEALYISLSRRLRDEDAPVPVMPPLPPDTAISVLRNSHELAAEILEQAPAAQVDFSDWLADQRGWLETSFFELRHHLLLTGTAYYQMYFFPAVRLALAAVGGRRNMTDSAARLMRERWETYERLREHLNLLNYNNLEEYPPDLIEQALVSFNECAENAPRDERVPCWFGGLLLRLNRLGEAEELFQRSLSLPTSRGDIHLEALDNLACVYARQNNEADCRRILEERARIKALDPQWLARDSDFDSVRRTAWFQSFLTTNDADGSVTDGVEQEDTNQ